MEIKEDYLEIRDENKALREETVTLSNAVQLVRTEEAERNEEHAAEVAGYRNRVTELQAELEEVESLQSTQIAELTARLEESEHALMTARSEASSTTPQSPAVANATKAVMDSYDALREEVVQMKEERQHQTARHKLELTSLEKAHREELSLKDETATKQALPRPMNRWFVNS